MGRKMALHLNPNGGLSITIGGGTVVNLDPEATDDIRAFLFPALRERIEFYELVLSECAPHSHGRHDKPCALAPEGESCCNPLCRGKWGTGCWCCHHGKYAPDVDDEDLGAAIKSMKAAQAGK